MVKNAIEFNKPLTFYQPILFMVKKCSLIINKKNYFTVTGSINEVT